MAYTDIDKPEDYFNTKLYTGNGTSQSITGVGFQPDWVWIKERTDAGSWHALFDAVRGVTKSIYSNESSAEVTGTAFTSFNTNGFTVGFDTTQARANDNGDTYVAWNWLAGGSASSNTDGSITSTVSANTTSGFSIVNYVANGVSGTTIGHGLGSVPACIILKPRDRVDNWRVYHHKVDATAPEDYQLYLQLDFARNDSASIWNDTAPTSSVFTIGSNSGVNTSGENFIAYCFAEKKGFSKFGGYTGNGSADGTFVYTGFKPAFVITKRTDSAENWDMLDNKRNTYNVSDKLLKPNLSNAEVTFSTLDMLSNGFKLKNSDAEFNASGGTYIYMALAENPFVTSTGIPTTAR